MTKLKSALARTKQDISSAKCPYKDMSNKKVRPTPLVVSQPAPRPLVPLLVLAPGSARTAAPSPSSPSSTCWCCTSSSAPTSTPCARAASANSCEAAKVLLTKFQNCERNRTHSNIQTIYRASHVLGDLGWVDLDLGSSPGWWAATVATYCPSRPSQLTWKNITKPCDR